MTFLIDNWFYLVIAATSGLMLALPALQKGGKGISANEAVRLINREKAVLVDVSEPAEYAASHAKGARNIPFGSLADSKDLPKNKALPIVLLCPSGARAGRAVGLLHKAGHEQAVSVAGGLRSWKEANLPMDSKPA